MFIQKKIILEENLSLMHNHPFSLFPTIWISLKLINRYDFNKLITIIIIIKNNRNLTFDRPSILWIPSISSVIPAAKTTNTTKLEWSTERVLPVYTRPRQATDPQSTSVTILSSVMNNLLQWQLLETVDAIRDSETLFSRAGDQISKPKSLRSSAARTMSSGRDKSNGRNVIDERVCRGNDSLADNGECDVSCEQETRCS